MTTMLEMRKQQSNRLQYEVEELEGALREAVALLSVEIRAYRDNDVSHYSKGQREGIANTLEAFCKKAGRWL